MTAWSGTRRRTSFDDFRVTGWLDEGEIGNARVTRVTPSSLGATIARLHGENISEREEITSLHVNGRLVMSDTRDEWRDHVFAIGQAQGRVLIHGLGLGCYLKAILAKPDVEHVDVVELSADVIELVGSQYEDERIHFHQGDAYTFQFPKGTIWDVAWHDIWSDICTDDLAGHATLNRRYARKVGWQGCWAHEQLLSNRRREKAAWWSS